MQMGDGTNLVRASNVIDDYSYILLNHTEQISNKVLFRCVTGLKPVGNVTNDMIGDIYYNGTLLTKGVCNEFVQSEGAADPNRFPGVYQARVCSNFSLTTSTEGVYTCTLRNSSSSMMDKSVRIGVYFNGRSMYVSYFMMTDHLLLNFFT